MLPPCGTRFFWVAHFPHHLCHCQPIQVHTHRRVWQLVAVWCYTEPQIVGSLHSKLHLLAYNQHNNLEHHCHFKMSSRALHFSSQVKSVLSHGLKLPMSEIISPQVRQISGVSPAISCPRSCQESLLVDLAVEFNDMLLTKVIFTVRLSVLNCHEK